MGGANTQSMTRKSVEGKKQIYGKYEREGKSRQQTTARNDDTNTTTVTHEAL